MHYTSNRKVTMNSGAKVDGTTTHQMPKVTEKPQRRQRMSLPITLWMYPATLLMMCGFAFALALLFPRPINNVNKLAVGSLGKTMLTGFLASLVVLPLVLMLCFSIIGIPLALFLVLLWTVVLMLSGPLAAYYLGSMVLSGSKNPLLIMLVGSIILVTLYFIPVLGFVAMLLALWVGSGALLRYAMLSTPRPTYRVE